MHKARFYVDFCFEAGSDDYFANVSGRYQFGVELSDEEFEDLYKIWFENNCELNSWSSEWFEHDVLYVKINEVATQALYMHMESDDDSIIKEPLNVYWQLSRETIASF